MRIALSAAIVMCATIIVAVEISHSLASDHREAAAESAAWNTFKSPRLHIGEVKYPPTYVLDNHYSLQNGNAKAAGVRFTISSTTAEEGFIADDTGVSIEETKSSNCDPSLFLPSMQKTTNFTVASTTYAVGAFASTDTGETVFVRKAPICTAVRYRIHAARKVSERDMQDLVAQFTKIRDSLHMQ